MSVFEDVVKSTSVLKLYERSAVFLHSWKLPQKEREPEMERERGGRVY